MRRRRSRSRFRPACSSIRSTPARRRFAGKPCPRSLSAATTVRWRAGGTAKPFAGRSPGGPISSTGGGCRPRTRPWSGSCSGNWRRRTAEAIYSAAGRRLDGQHPTHSKAAPCSAAPTTKESLVNVLDEIVSDQLRTDLPELASGDTVRVSAKVVEGNRERIQVFEGTVMRLRGGGISRSITVRRIASGVGVERTFKIHSPRIEKIDVVRHGQVRRAQLYFLRKRVGKAATLRERRTRS